MAESVTLSAAQAVVEAARAKAEEIGVPMDIAVVDEGNNLTAFARMDGAWLGSIDIAQNKAYTARSLRHVDARSWRRWRSPTSRCTASRPQTRAG